MAESPDDFLRRTGAASGNTTSASESPDDFLKRTGAAAAPATQDQKGGVARNIAAGTLEGEGGVMNLLSDPAGNLLHLGAVAGGTAFDAVAHALGYAGMSSEQRADLYGTSDQEYQSHPGTTAINALSQAVGTGPGNVTATTPSERVARAGAAGVAASPLIPGGVLAPIIGGGASIAGEEAARRVPEWAQPGTELAVNLLTGLAIPFGAAGIKAGLGPVARGVNAYVNAPGEGLIPGRTSPGGPQPGMEPPPKPIATPSAPAPATVDTPWVSNTTADIQRVLQENAEAGGPTSLGAMATPEQLSKMTPAQVKANRRVAELNQIVSPIEGEDTTEWVRGSTPTEAERMGTPTASQKEVMTRQRNPDAFEGPNGQLTINDKARVHAFDETLLSDTQADDLKERQQAAASKAQGQILATAKPVDFKPAADWIEARLADPLIQEDKYVYNSLKGLRDQLYDADGNLKTDPRAAWGMHNNLRNKLLDAKDPLSANPSEKYAVTQVNEFKRLVDGALDKASDGQFQAHLDTQAEYLKSLNAWRLLNDFRYGPNKMINAKSGMINANAFHRFVTDLAIRRGKPGIDAAMDVPDDVMQRLININQDLKRAGRIDLGKPRGSPTNLFFELAGALGISGAHALTAAMTAGTPLGGIANIGVQTGISAIQRRLGQRRLNALTKQALQPPPGGLTPPPGNLLQQGPP